MKQFRTILKFELKNIFANKIFVGVTVFIVILLAGVMFFPRLSESFSSGDKNNSEPLPVMLIGGESASAAEQVFTAAYPGYDVRNTDASEDEIKEKIISGDAQCAFVADSLTSYTYYVNNLSMYDVNTETADEIFKNLYRTEILSASGISPQEASQIIAPVITHNTENLGKDQMKNFFYTYIMIFALYFVILFYGQMVAMNVATEKSSRAMELLITSAKPLSMMFGKILASCSAGLIQLVVMFGSSLLFYRLNASYWEGNMIVDSLFNMPVELLLYMILFFVLGFLIFAFMFGAVGSTVSKTEDINTAVMPVTLVFIAGFMIVMFSMGSGNVDNTAMKICSFVPFTSPMAMFTRIAMSTVNPAEIIISVLILILSAVGIGILSAKIYRTGVLLYGTPPTPAAIFKAMKKDKKK